MIARTEISLTVDSKARAAEFRAFARHRGRQMVRDFLAGMTICPAISETIDEYCRWLEVVRSTSAVRIKYIKRCLAMFATQLSVKGEPVRVDDVTRDHMIKWLARRRKRGLRVTTINNELAVFKSYCRWLAHFGGKVRLGDVEPMTIPAMVDKRTVSGELPPKFVSEAEYHRIARKLAEAAPHILIVLEGMLLFGARPVVLFGLRWHHVEWPDGRREGRVDIPQAKGGLRGSVPVMTGSVTEALLKRCQQIAQWEAGTTSQKPVFARVRGRSRINPGGWTTAAYDNALKRAMATIGIERPFTAYMVRHSAATWLEQYQVSSGGIQHYMKHLRPSTQDKYRHGTGELAREAYPVIEQLLTPQNGTPE